jgi:hypothetical protein
MYLYELKKILESDQRNIEILNNKITEQQEEIWILELKISNQTTVFVEKNDLLAYFKSMMFTIWILFFFIIPLDCYLTWHPGAQTRNEWQ